MKNLARIPSLFLFVSLLAGCSLFGIEKPETFPQRLAYAYSTQTAVAQEIAAKTRSGVLSSADNQRFVAIIEDAKAVADGARDAMRGGDTATAEGKLRLAQNILVEVDQFLRSRE
jgi:hypothetical protein